MSNLKRFLALTLAMLMVVGAMVTVSAKSFTDVASDDAYAEAVDVLSELGVILGTSEEEFSPDTLVERQQMAMFIARLATAQPSWFAVEAPAVFKDQTAPVYNAAVAYANTNGFVKGTSATTFEGAKSVTLQDAATMLSRVLGYTTEAMDKAYPMSYLTMADDVGLLKGLEDVAPTAALTRGEVAIMLYNALKAPMATTFLTSGADGKVVINVSIPEDISKAKTLIVDKWKVAVKDSFIAATKDFRFEGYTVKPTKTLTDPVTLANVQDNVSFAAISKYFEDATANELLGVDIKVFVRNGKILTINVLGDVTSTTVAEYIDKDDAKTVKVEGAAYDLKAYPIDGKYPSESDNCFYTYKNNVITKVTAADIATIKKIQNGLFIVDVINAGKDTQKIVIMPYAFSKVEAKDGALWVNGKTNKITDNTVGAKENDYVVYFNGGDKLVKVIEIAKVTSGLKVATINLTSDVATFTDGTKAPAKAGSIIDGATRVALSIGSTYDVISAANGVVLSTSATATAVKPYAPKTYYTVKNTNASQSGLFGEIKFPMLYVNNAGNEVTLFVTHVDGTELTDANKALWDTAITGYAATLKGKSITIDGTKVYTDKGAVNPLTDEFSADKANDSSIVSNAATDFRNQSTIFSVATAAGAVNFVLTDYSKIVIESDLGAGNAGNGYNTFSGKTFKGFNDAAVASGNVTAVVHKNAAGINELVYLYAKTTTQTKDQVKNASTVTPAANLYVFLSVDSFDDTSVTFNAIKLSTGTLEQVKYVKTDGNKSADILTAVGFNTAGVKLGKTSAIYDVQTVSIPAASLNVKTGEIRRADTGYISAAGTTLTANNTKYYRWNADTNTFDAKTAADVEAGKYYTGLVAYNNTTLNADFVIVLDAASTATPVITPVTGTTVEAGRDAITIAPVAGADVYYTTDGTVPTDKSTKYTGTFTVTGAAGSKVTVKAIAVSAATGTSAVASVEYTLAVTARVATPIATQTGNVAKNTSVMIGSTTEGSVLIYSTDGGTTWTTAASNSVTLTLNTIGVNTIKAYAIKFGMTNSDTATFNYVVGSVDAGLTKIDTYNVAVTGSEAGTALAPKAAGITVPNGTTTIDATSAKAAAAAGATVTVYNDATFATLATATHAVANKLYVKVVSESGTVTMHYVVTITVAP